MTIEGVAGSGVAHQPLRTHRSPKIDFKFATEIVLYAAAYYLAFHFGHLFTHSQASPFWIPNSVLLCALLRNKSSRWWIFLLIPLPIRQFADVSNGLPGFLIYGGYGLDCLKAVVSAAALRRFLPDPLRFQTVKEFAIFCLIPGFLVPAVSAFAGAGLHGLMGEDYWLAWRRWFLGDVLAQLAITPAILWMIVNGWRNFRALGRSQSIEAGFTLLGLVLAIYFFGQQNNLVSPLGSFFLLPLFLIIWVAVRFGMLGASVAFAIVSFFITASALAGRGPFSNQTPDQTALSLQAFLAPRALAIYVVALLIEQLKRAHALLSQREQRFRSMANRAPVMIWRSGPDKLCDFFNQRWLDFTGRSMAQEMGKGWIDGVHPQDLQHRLQVYETAFDARQPFETEYRLRDRDGEYHWILDRGAPLSEPDGAFEGYIGSALDISDRKKVEELNDALTHMQRVAAVGELSAAITHEVRQPLAAILLNMRTAEKLLEVSNPSNSDIRAIIADIITDIKASVSRANDVIDRTKNFYRKQEMEKQPVNINTAISQVMQLAVSEAKQRSVILHRELEDGLPSVLADPVQMQQVLINLIVNGMDAMTDIPKSARHLTVQSRRHDTDSVEITVSDRGHGINPDMREHVFETFFSTKKTGVGIGLSIARSIVIAHDGRIWVEDNPAGGARFHVTLPVVERDAATTAA